MPSVIIKIIILFTQFIQVHFVHLSPSFLPSRKVYVDKDNYFTEVAKTPSGVVKMDVSEDSGGMGDKRSLDGCTCLGNDIFLIIMLCMLIRLCT